MASGRTHDRITLWTLPLVVVLAFRVTLDGWLTGVVCLGFLLGGWVLGPDLDIHSVQYKRWGWLRWIWLPYRGRIRHRSHWSHGPVIGTVVRVVYLLLWLALAGLGGVAVLKGLGRTELTWAAVIQGLGGHLQSHWLDWLALLVGLELGALSHYSADWITSAWKRQVKVIKPRTPGAGRVTPRKTVVEAPSSPASPRPRRPTPSRGQSQGRKKKRPSR